MIAPTLSPPPPPTPGRTGAEQVEEPSTKITKRVTAGAVEIQPAVGHPPDANRPAGFSAVTPGHPQDVDDITAWVDSGAPLHVNSRVGQAIQADGSRVSTGEGYDASAEASAGSTSGSLTAGVSSLRIHAEDLMCFPPQFPLDSGGGLLGKLGNRLAPRFADRHFERRYQEHRGQGLDSVQLYFAGALACFTATLWVYHLTSPHGFDRQSQVGLSLTNCALLVAVFFWAVLRFHPRLRARSSAVHALQITMLITLFSWGLPATARETCSDAYNTFDSNLHQTVFTCLLYGAVFCRVGTSAFAVVCLVALVNIIVARSVWSQLKEHSWKSAATFELPKLVAALFIVYAGVRRTDVYLRRDFAARELMLMVIEEPGQEMEAALKAAAAIGREMDTPSASE